MVLLLAKLVYLMGSPVNNDKKIINKIRSVASGSIYNIYSKNDWILAYAYRASVLSLFI